MFSKTTDAQEVVALFDELRAPVLRYLITFRLPVPDAEEIVQDVFLALFQHMRKGRPRDNLRGWVFQVAHNSALKQRARLARLNEQPSPTGFVDSPDPAPNPEQLVESTQRQRRLLAVVEALPEQDQCCLSLRAEGLRYREIAGVLGISLGSVANSLERSLARLARADAL